jgi:Holliday junction resolvase RusA-like endonuclease
VNPTDRASLLALLCGTPDLDVVIAEKPRGKGRPRIDTRSGRMHTDAKTEGWEKRAAAELQIAWRGRQPIPGDEPVVVEIECVVARPQRLDRADPGRHPTTAKPDVDNAAKIVLDAMTRTVKRKTLAALVKNVLVDDKCVVGLLTTKAYAAMGEEPHVRVRLFRLQGALL